MSIYKTLEYSRIDGNNKIISTTININICENKEKQMYCIHRALKQQLGNNRIRNAHTKTRSEIRGGGKKPWKQKGTGRARAGSNRSPLWRGGGVIFGPRQKIYNSKINKKEKKLAINSIIYNKHKSTIFTNDIIINSNKPNTQEAILAIKKTGIDWTIKKRILIIVRQTNHILYLSLRNIPNVELINVKNLNVLSLLHADNLIITSSALEKINLSNNSESNG
uniref:Large ribosomal subunit protein uL4c n=1 Tax=Digenea simplex TaxID=945030 RepID=A0A1Z1MV06_DIGSM|nr:ribosomal protein L4 [Digenea simplex]ARW69575.1 ribosomal protein L4 [Digenea simplex]